MPARKTPRMQGNEQDIDNEKHGRAMDLLYRLQQRQEHVTSTMQRNSVSQYTGDMLESELQAIDEALSRLHRVFKQAKSELNSSQHFPTSGSTADSVKRKQVQINARLTKCISLTKVQKNLMESYEQMKKRGMPAADDSSETGDGSCECSTCDTDSTTFDMEVDEGGSESLASDSLSTFSSVVVKRRHTIPFRQPAYSQHSHGISQAQTILDDILGCGGGVPDASIQPTGPPAGYATVIGSFNGKMFASPPRPALLSQHSESNKAADVTNHSLNESCTSYLMDATGIFEPSQKESLYNQPPDVDMNSGSVKRKPSTVTSDINLAAFPKTEPWLKHPRIYDTAPESMNPATSEMVTLSSSPRKFAMTSTMNVRLISNGQLRRLADDVWNLQSSSALPEGIFDEITGWD